MYVGELTVSGNENLCHRRKEKEMPLATPSNNISCLNKMSTNYFLHHIYFLLLMVQFPYCSDGECNSVLPVTDVCIDWARLVTVLRKHRLYWRYSSGHSG